ncbi:MAG: hypothetical protein JWM64_973 [Frankiales bacterium]|nr:hypothetical protein [Frankiales bacterium]
MDDDLCVEPQRFSIVPEWMIDADVSDAAFRLYAVLLRYGGTSGSRMPSRSTLARRIRKQSVDSVDRAMKELERLGAVVVERRKDGAKHLTNRYHLRTSQPGRSAAATSPTPAAAGRTGAATAGRTDTARGSRTGAAPVAAPVRHDPEPSTESTLTQPADLARRVVASRAEAGLSTRAWGPDAIERAVVRAQERGWPTTGVEAALLAVAVDPASRSPLRVAEAGPWWVGVVEDTPTAEQLVVWEHALDELDGQRVLLQRRAREELRNEGVRATRTTVLARAAALAGLDTAGRSGALAQARVEDLME